MSWAFIGMQASTKSSVTIQLVPAAKHLYARLMKHLHTVCTYYPVHNKARAAFLSSMIVFKHHGSDTAS